MYFKAVKRVQRNVSNSSTKRTAVVRRFAESFHVQLLPVKQSKPSPLAITEDTTLKVKEFYDSNDISRLPPGKKDFVTVHEDGKKEHK
ncbi:hypothetical protein PR048_008967 [Dryococelus australis]|uniref:Uncharacterized protein n=1 Tax=Dryococelus australis TaxID=614101 RepID=A0ABQ9HYL1_9NEOP|nr:hypothetical protein PR048_008967 [Dryococelus australis]